MKRARGNSCELTNGDHHHKKRKLESDINQESSEDSWEGSVASDDWDDLTGGKLVSACREEMVHRKVLINDKNQHFEKPNGHLVLKPGDTIGGKYQVDKKLGEGTFGKVYRCKTLSPGLLFGIAKNNKRAFQPTCSDVAIKVIRAQKKYMVSAFIEINTILMIHHRQATLHESCVALIDWFAVGNNVCMVFPLYGESLLTYINKVRFTSTTHLRDIAWQILIGLARIHQQGLIHTDLKPENILFVKAFETGTRGSSSSFLSTTDIIMIDFGNSTFEESYHTRIIGTRHYRAPEVLLGMDWSYSSDIWAVGCILMEMYTGKVLFSPKGDLEHLGMMENAIGRIPSYIGRKAVREAKEYFDRDGRLWWREIRDNTESRHAVERVRQIKKTVDAKDEDLYQLIMAMLDFDPEKRCTALEALRFPFFTRVSVYRKQLETLAIGRLETTDRIRISSTGIVSKV